METTDRLISIFYDEVFEVNQVIEPQKRKNQLKEESKFMQDSHRSFCNWLADEQIEINHSDRNTATEMTFYKFEVRMAITIEISQLKKKNLNLHILLKMYAMRFYFINLIN